jgi:tellurite resistance protein
LPRDALLQAVIDLCRDLLDEQTGEHIRVTDPAHVDALLDAVGDTEARVLVVRAMLVLSKADGTISAPERTLLRRALTRWDLTLEAVAA